MNVEYKERKYNMNKKYLITFLAVLTAFMMMGCGGEKEESGRELSRLLPARLAETGFTRASEIRTFVGNSLWEYIDGQAELYYQYDFVDVATSNYTRDDIEFEVDIYRFATADGSYGIYSMFRNPADNVIQIGVEGFISPGWLVFVKDVYLVKLTGFDESEESNTAIVDLAETFEGMLTGKVEKPAAFGQFPPDNIINKSDKYYAESFLGQKFLTRVFCRDYLSGDDTLTLFITRDEMADKYAQWLEMAEKTGRKSAPPQGLLFDSEYSFIYDDPFHDQIIVGLKNQKLAGIVHFSGKLNEYLNLWLETL